MQLEERLLESFRGYSVPVDRESSVQKNICKILETEGIPYEREVALDERSRIDFMVGDVGIEVKVKGSFQQVYRQLHRYAQFDRIRVLVLASTSSRLSREMPGEIEGKKLHVHTWLPF